MVHQPNKDNTTVPPSKSNHVSDWIDIKYIGETFEIMEGVMFEKGTVSGLPVELWEQFKHNENMKDWIVI